MATTAKGTPYVESSDLVADYPSVSLALAEHIDDFGGKVLQVVRATDTTNRSTTSTSFVDVTGMSVTITPQRSTSAILIFCNFFGVTANGTNDNVFGFFQITDSSNNAISGAQRLDMGSANITGTGTRIVTVPVVLIAYDTPATTSAVTYKLRFRSSVSQTTTTAENATSTGQLFAIEVSA